MSNTFPRLGKPAPLFEGDVVRFDSRKKQIFFDIISLNKILEEKNGQFFSFTREIFQIYVLLKFIHLIEELKILKRLTVC